MVLPYESEDYGGAGITYTAGDDIVIDADNEISTTYKDLVNFETDQNNISIGANAGASLTTPKMKRNVYIGNNAGSNATEGLDCVCIGSNAGSGITNAPGRNVIAIGNFAGNDAGNNSVNLGQQAGYTNSGNSSINIGQEAALNNSNHNNGEGSINIGQRAGRNNPKQYCINIGQDAGWNGGNNNSINIGREAGRNQTGTSSINIGHKANETGTAHNNSIVINATGINLPSNANSSFVIKPLRQIDHKIGFGLLYYDQVTGELSSSITNITRFEAVFTTDPTDITTSGSTIVFDTTNYNVNSAYSTSTGQFTSPRNALYRFECFYQLSTNDSLSLDWKRNGSVDKTEEVYNAHGGSSYRTFTASWTGVLNTNDTLEIAISAISGTMRFSSATKNGLIGYYIGL